MEEDYDALEAEAEAELAALAAEAAAAAQGAGSRSEDGGIVMLPVSPRHTCIAVCAVTCDTTWLAMYSISSTSRLR